MNETDKNLQTDKAKPQQIAIIVNATQHTVNDKDLTYTEVVKLAFPDAVIGGNTIYTVTYKKGPPPHQQGSIDVGDTVKIKKGMVFNVTPTDKS